MERKSTIFVGSFHVILYCMTADFSISFTDRLWMETLSRFPFVSRFIHAFKNPNKPFIDLAYKLVSVKDLLLSRKIVVGEDFDVKGLDKVVAILTIVKKATGRQTSQHFIEMHQSIDISLAAIAEIHEIVAEFQKYARLKSDMFTASSNAMVSNLKKYKEPVYDNK